MIAPAVAEPNTPSAPPRKRDAGADQGALQGDDARAALVVAGEAGAVGQPPAGCAAVAARTDRPSSLAVASSTTPVCCSPLTRW